MVSKLTQRSVEQKKVEVAKPKPKAVAKAPPQKLAKDELSSGRGQRLRASAERNLAATPFSSKAAEAGAALGAFRVNALGALSKSSTVATVSTAAAVGGPPASEEVQEQVEQRLRTVTSSNDFAFQLENETDPAVRDEMVRQAMNSENASIYLGNSGFPQETLNADFDVQKTIATAVGHAFANGSVTQEDVNQAVEHLGEDGSEFFVAAMSMDGSNRALGGVVEAVGIAAEKQGFERATALAFTTSESMIDKHLPTAEAQRAAFEEVENFIEEYDDLVEGRDGEPAALRTGMEFALASAARLSARGNGYTDAELDEELKEVGPRIAQETVARLGENARFDNRVPGALDTLGDSAKRLGALDNDEADDFRVASAMAYTQSPQLISRNLTTDADKRAALETLNTFLADRRESFGDAAEGEFSLLRDPQALDGINNLLASSPALIGQLVNGGPAGEATLVQLMETISLNPNVPQAERDRFNASINSFLTTEMARANESPNVVGAEIGKLLGLIQVAGNRAVEGAKEEDQGAARAAVQGLVKGVAGAVVGLALAETGPIGVAVGKTVVGLVIDQLFKEPPGPTQAQVRNAFVAQLEAEGIDVSSGEAGADALTGALRETLDALNNALNDVPESEQDAIRDQIALLDQLNTSIGISFGGTINSEGGAAGELARELDRREDEI
ncbi:MAG: hypothetical protein H6Q89_4537 [Myxococcaceae bacterium]|nr:hypothetical protein [Myxococcaceae bacterium]